MMEYFAYKKAKKHNEERKAIERARSRTPPPGKVPVLTADDEDFLRHMVSDEPANRPSLPTRPTDQASAAQFQPSAFKEAGDITGNNQQLVLHQTTIEDDPAEVAMDEESVAPSAIPTTDIARSQDGPTKPTSRLAGLTKKFSRKPKETTKTAPLDDGLTEEQRERADLAKALDNLNLVAEKNSAFSLSAETRVILQKFIQILKDMVNGVPTVYDDMTKLFDNSQEYFDKTYDNLPGFLKKLVKTLPQKLPMGPELLAAAAARAELGKAGNEGMTFKQAAKSKGLRVPNLKELITAPGAALTMLRAIMNFLKLRWPALLGTNILWSMGIFLLLFVFYHCWKRGREERLRRDANGAVILGPDGKPIERMWEELSSSDESSASNRRAPPRHNRSESRSASRAAASRRSLHSRENSRQHSGPPSPLRLSNSAHHSGQSTPLAPDLATRNSHDSRTHLTRQDYGDRRRSGGSDHRHHERRRSHEYADRLSPADGEHRWEQRRHQRGGSYEDDDRERRGALRRSHTEGEVRRRIPRLREADRPSQAPVSSQESCSIQ